MIDLRGRNQLAKQLLMIRAQRVLHEVAQPKRTPLSTVATFGRAGFMFPHFHAIKETANPTRR